MKNLTWKRWIAGLGMAAVIMGNVADAIPSVAYAAEADAAVEDTFAGEPAEEAAPADGEGFVENTDAVGDTDATGDADYVEPAEEEVLPEVTVDEFAEEEDTSDKIGPVSVNATVVDEFGNEIDERYTDVELPSFRDTLYLDDPENPPYEKVRRRTGSIGPIPTYSPAYDFVQATINGSIVSYLYKEAVENEDYDAWFYSDGGELIRIEENTTIVMEYCSPDSTDASYQYADSSLILRAQLEDANALPDEAALVVTPVNASTAGYSYDAYIEALTQSNEALTEEKTLLYDIAFLMDGWEVEPENGSVKISLEFLQQQLTGELEAADGSELVVTHLALPDDVRKAYMSTAAATDLAASDIIAQQVLTAAAGTSGGSNDVLEFTLDSLSMIAVTRVDRADYNRASGLGVAVRVNATVVDEFGKELDEAYTGIALPEFEDILVLNDTALAPIDRVRTVKRKIGFVTTYNNYEYVSATVDGAIITALKKVNLPEGGYSYLYTTDGENWTPLMEDATLLFEYAPANAAKTTFEYKDADVSVTAVLEKPDALPADAELVVTPVVSGDKGYETYMEALNNAEEGNISEDNVLLYDVAFMVTDENGNRVEYQPEEGSVKITVNFLKKQLSEEIAAETAQDVEVVHMPLVKAVKESADTTLDADFTADDVIVEHLDASAAVGNNEQITFTMSDFSIIAVLTQYGTYNMENMTDYSLYNILNNYTIFMGGDVTSNHQVGAVAIGGNGTIGTMGASAVKQGADSYIKGKANTGNVISSATKNGYVLLGNVNKNGHNVQGVNVGYTDEYIDFDKAFTSIDGQVSALANKSGFWTDASTQNSGLQLQAGGNYRITDFQNATWGNLSGAKNASADTNILVESSGTVTFPSFLFPGLTSGEGGDGTSIVWLFPNASKVIIGSNATPFFGHVIAPNGTIEMQGGNYNGCLVAKNGGSSLGEGHYWPYNGHTFTPTATEIKVAKKLVDDQGNDVSFDGKKFSFTLSPVDGAPMPAGSRGGTKTVEVSDTTAVSFGDITYSDKTDHDYKYKVTEVVNNDDKSITYDTTVYDVTVHVIGSESAASIGSITYTSTKNGVTSGEQTLGGALTFTNTKGGDSAKGAFRFTLSKKLFYENTKTPVADSEWPAEGFQFKITKYKRTGLGDQNSEAERDGIPDIRPVAGSTAGFEVEHDANGEEYYIVTLKSDAQSIEFTSTDEFDAKTFYDKYSGHVSPTYTNPETHYAAFMYKIEEITGNARGITYNVVDTDTSWGANHYRYVKIFVNAYRENGGYKFLDPELKTHMCVTDRNCKEIQPYFVNFYTPPTGSLAVTKKLDYSTVKDEFEEKRGGDGAATNYWDVRGGMKVLVSRMENGTAVETIELTGWNSKRDTTMDVTSSTGKTYHTRMTYLDGVATFQRTIEGLPYGTYKVEEITDGLTFTDKGRTQLEGAKKYVVTTKVDGNAGYETIELPVISRESTAATVYIINTYKRPEKGRLRIHKIIVNDLDADLVLHDSQTTILNKVRFKVENIANGRYFILTGFTGKKGDKRQVYFNDDPSTPYTVTYDQNATWTIYDLPSGEYRVSEVGDGVTFSDINEELIAPYLILVKKYAKTQSNNANNEDMNVKENCANTDLFEFSYGDSELIATVSKDHTDRIHVCNNYTNPSAALEVKKELIGRTGDVWTDDDVFTFELTAGANNAGVTTPMPESGSEIVTIDKDTPDKTAAFGKINFTKAGIYNYTVREKEGSLKDISYDQSVYTAVIEVVEELRTITKHYQGETRDDEQQIGLSVKSIDYFDAQGNPLTTAVPVFRNTTLKGTISVTKIRKDSNNVRLAGAEFTVYSDKNATAPVKDKDGNDMVLTTNAQGYAESGSLTAGVTYYVKETKAPANYVLSNPNPIYEVKVVANVITPVKTSDGKTNIENKPTTINAKVDKFWLSDDVIKVEIKFYLMRKLKSEDAFSTNMADAVDTLIKEMDTSETNYFYGEFEDLPVYDEKGNEYEYKVVEEPVSITKRVDGKEVTIKFEATYSDPEDLSEDEKGFGVTNTELVDIPVTKTWAEGEPEEDITVTVALEKKLPGGEWTSTGLTKELKKGAWTQVFEDLPKYDADLYNQTKDKEASRISYRVTEPEVPEGYEVLSVLQNDDGSWTITNTKLAEVTIKKVWKDDNNAEAIAARPDELDMTLNCSDGTSQKVTLTAAENWEKSITGLPSYKNGEAVTYSWSEDSVPTGYVYSGTKTDGMLTTITNTRIGDTEVPVEKVWIGEAGSATFTLYADGVEVANKTLTLSGTTTRGKFDKLPKYNSQGKLITYTVEEAPINDYSSATPVLEGGVWKFVNTNNEKIEIPVKKTWKGTPGTQAVTVKLLADGADTHKSVELNSGNNWESKFTDLRKYDAKDGHAIKYTIEEVNYEGFTSTIGGTAETGFEVINTRTGKISIPVTKIWKGPKGSATFTLYKKENGKAEAVAGTLTLSGNNTSGSFDDLDKYDANGNEIEYRVDETVYDDEKYVKKLVSSANNSWTFENTDIEEVELPVEKKWVDANDEEAIAARPEITVVLMKKESADGKFTDTDNKRILNQANDWKATFTKLAKYTDDGYEIQYDVREVEVAGYKSSKVGNLTTGITITNTRFGEINIPVEKVWIGEAGSATFTLYANGEDTGRKLTLSGKTNTTGSFKDLAKYDAQGKAITYTVEEAISDDFTCVSKVQDGNGWKFVNTNNEMFEIPVEKIWKGTPGTKPVTVKLYADGKDTGKSVELNSENKWKGKFTELRRYDAEDGHVIEYTTEEVAYEGYNSSVKGIADKNGFTFTNTKTGKVTIPVTKIWKGPKGSAEFELFANGQTTGKKLRLSGNTTTGEFANLDQYDADGVEIDYTVKETVYDDSKYTAAPGVRNGNSWTFTNTNIEKTRIDVRKVWDGDVGDTRISVGLIADGASTGKYVTLSEANDWRSSFENLDKYAEDGHEIAYTVSEVEVRGYISRITGSAARGFVITNTQQRGSVNLYKKDGYTGVTLAGARFGLFREDGVQVDQIRTSGNDGLIRFSGLRFGTYYLEELEAPAGYTRRTDRYYFTIDAEHGVSEPVVLEAYNDPAMVAIDGAKIWDDQGNADNIRPASIQVILYANGVEAGIKTVAADAAGDWLYDFGRLPKYDENGREINYTIAETIVEGYTGRTEKLVDADGNISFVITNSHTPTTPPPTPVPPTPPEILPIRIRPGVLGVTRQPPAPTPTVNPSVLGARRAVLAGKRGGKVLGARRASTGDDATMVAYGLMSGGSFAGFWAWILAALKRKKAQRQRKRSKS